MALFSTGTGGDKIAAGTTAQRPTVTAADAGMIRFNTTIGSMERWDGTSWDPLPAGDFVKIPGDTMTGNLNLPSLIASGSVKVGGTETTPNATIGGGGEILTGEFCRFRSPTFPDQKVTIHGGNLFGQRVGIEIQGHPLEQGSLRKPTHLVLHNAPMDRNLSLGHDKIVWSSPGLGAYIGIGTDQLAVGVGDYDSNTDIRFFFFQRDGSFIANGVSYPSDAKLKTEVVDLTPASASSLVKSLEPRSYKLKSDEDGLTRYGFIAQEVEAVIPELVSDITFPEEEESTKALDYVGLIPFLTASLKEALTRIETLEASNAALAARLDAAGA